MKKKSHRPQRLRTCLLLVFIFALVFLALKGSTAFLPNPNPAVWQITSDNSTAYLLGTISVGNDDFYPLSDKIESFFAASSKLVLEVDLTTINPEAVNDSIVAQALYPENETITDHLTAAEFTLLAETLTQFGIPTDNLLGFRPWFLMVMIEALQYQLAGYFPDLSVDLYFLSKAQDKEIFGLETAIEQATLYAQFSAETEKRLLMDKISTNLEQEIQDLVAAWWFGDLANLERSFHEKLQQDPVFCEVYQQIYVERNIKMAEKISEFLTTGGDYFIMIQSGHLLGEGSIINLLTEKGFTVTLL